MARFDKLEDALGQDYTVTRTGNYSPQTREATVRALKFLFDGEITVKLLKDSPLSESCINRHFEGIAEAEIAAFGAKKIHTCEVCGQEFEDRGSYTAHTSNCTEDSYNRRVRAENLLNISTQDAKHTIYRLRVEHKCDNSEYWYLGQTVDLKNRVYNHLSQGDSKISMPHNGELKRCHHYTVSSFEVLDGAETQGAARDKERIWAHRTAIENNTTDVLGGK